MDLVVGHLGHLNPAHGTLRLAPTHNLAVHTIRADRYDTPSVFNATPAPNAPPRDRFEPCADRYGHGHDRFALTPTLDATQPYACRPNEPAAPSSHADHPPGFPRLDASSRRSTSATRDVIVQTQHIPITAPATLGVMLDLFA